MYIFFVFIIVLIFLFGNHFCRFFCFFCNFINKNKCIYPPFFHYCELFPKREISFQNIGLYLGAVGRYLPFGQSIEIRDNYEKETALRWPYFSREPAYKYLVCTTIYDKTKKANRISICFEGFILE